MLLRPFLPVGLLALALAACAPPAVIVPTTVQIPPVLPVGEAPRGEEPAPPRLLEGSTEEQLAWSLSEPESVARARREHRPMILDFMAEWCMACKELDRETYSDPRVRAALKRFIKVKVDATNDEDPLVEAIKSRYRVVGLPTVILLDSIGKESSHITQFVSADQLLILLDSIK